MRQFIQSVLLGFSAVCVLGACTSTTPHENFKNHMKDNVGRKADDPFSSIIRYSDRVIGKTALPNGNTEVKYRGRGTCITYFEVDSKTNIIVGWRFEGSEKDCAIAP
jgi:hypothetical protein